MTLDKLRVVIGNINILLYNNKKTRHMKICSK